MPAPSGLLVHPDRVPEVSDVPGSPPGEPSDGPEHPAGITVPPRKPEPPHLRPTQFYAQLNLDPVRCIKQLGEIAGHVSSQLGSDVELVLEIRVKNDEGFDESTRHTGSESARSLGAQSSEFEQRS